MRFGDIVTLNIDDKAGRSYVVVHEALNGRVQLCYCGAERWYVPEWVDVSWVGIDVTDGPQLRRARRLLAAVKPDPDGWKRIQVGRAGRLRTVIVGHVDVTPAIETGRPRPTP